MEGQRYLGFDQGSQYTSEGFTRVLKEHGIKISMDGKGSFRDNIFIERLWRSLKYELIYNQEFASVAELRKGLTEWFYVVYSLQSTRRFLSCRKARVHLPGSDGL